MTDRTDLQRLLRELHAARLDADLVRLCRLFAQDAHFKIAGASDGKSIAISARGIDEIRPWLAMMVKTFRLMQYQLLSAVIDGERSALYWRVDIHSKITGAVVPTELVDLIETRDGRITSYVEFFVPCAM